MTWGLWPWVDTRAQDDPNLKAQEAHTRYVRIVEKADAFKRTLEEVRALPEPK